MSPSQSKILRNTAVLVALIVLGLIMLIPLIWTVMLSLKSNGDLLRSTANAFHAPYTGENYVAIMQNSQVLHWLMNSVIVSGLTTLGVLILSSLAGYGFARLDFPGRDKLFLFVLFGLAIPEQAVIITRHQMFSALHLHNSFPGLILPGLAAPFGVFLMTQYFRAIPKELDEAALLDNASKFRVFWQVLLPLTIPAQATLGIFTFLSSWNDYWWPLISATRADMFTLTVGLASSQINFAQTSGLGYLMTQAVFASVPILIVYIIFQKYIVKAVSGAAVR
ncbi:MAG: carbohydrate ABC transporter permease [Asticcacaulis sp.]|uniref:carbohydrate ABC transporter permease n=1 Tax=Asticcacaulis sp. TaxID=1872648 RepID=UPI0039E64C9F